jgi:hypothetical protein
VDTERSSKTGDNEHPYAGFLKLCLVNLGRLACLALILGPQFGQAVQQTTATHPLPVASQGGHSRAPAQVFKSLLPQIKEQTKVPVFLPSDLPQQIGKAKYSVAGDLQADKYEISLYYELGIGDAGFAAFFTGQADAKYRPEELPNVKEVKLARGTKGFFWPVSCGGSCAPANLWWMDGGVLYQIQLKLPATMSERDQENMIIAAANSAITAGPR